MKRRLILRAVYAACLLAGTWTHVTLVWRHGLLWDYGGVSEFTRVYWTSLTLLDPLTALTLFVYPRVGLVATLVIILSDVAHNLWFGATYHISFNWMIAAQCAFLIFVLATLRATWRSLSATPAMTRRGTLA